MTVTDEANCDMNGFSEQKRYRILHTRGRKTPQVPPAATRKRLGLCLRRVPMPSFQGWHDFCLKNGAGPHSHYGTTAINILRTRTVSRYSYDTDKKDRILTMGKYNDSF